MKLERTGLWIRRDDIHVTEHLGAAGHPDTIEDVMATLAHFVSLVESGETISDALLRYVAQGVRRHVEGERTLWRARRGPAPKRP